MCNCFKRGAHILQVRYFANEGAVCTLKTKKAQTVYFRLPGVNSSATDRAILQYEQFFKYISFYVFKNDEAFASSVS